MGFNLNEFIAFYAANFDISAAEAGRRTREVIEALTKFVDEEVTPEQGLTIRNFCKFKKVLRPAGEKRNPATGGTVTVPERTVVKIKASVRFGK